LIGWLAAEKPLQSMMKKRLPILLVAGLCGAWTFHRSFTHRDVGFGTTAKVSVPVESRVAAALDEGRKKQAAKTLSIIGKVTRVSDGDTLILWANWIC